MTNEDSAKEGQMRGVEVGRRGASRSDGSRRGVHEVEAKSRPSPPMQQSNRKGVGDEEDEGASSLARRARAASSKKGASKNEGDNREDGEEDSESPVMKKGKNVHVDNEAVS